MTVFTPARPPSPDDSRLNANTPEWQNWQNSENIRADKQIQLKIKIHKSEKRADTCFKTATGFAGLGACLYAYMQCASAIPFMPLHIVCCTAIAVLFIMAAAWHFYQQKVQDKALDNTSHELRHFVNQSISFEMA